MNTPAETHAVAVVSSAETQNQNLARDREQQRVKSYSLPQLSRSVHLGTNQWCHTIDQKTAEDIVSFYTSKGFVNIDTAMLYSKGKAERMLGNLMVQRQQQPQQPQNSTRLRISTKARFFSTAAVTADDMSNSNNSNNRIATDFPITDLNHSLDRLRLEKVVIFYIHAPFRKYSRSFMDLKDMLIAFNQLYVDHKFEYFGLCNFAAFEITEIYYLCRKLRLEIRPTYVQGRYNICNREIEQELLPCLKHLHIRFIAYQVLCCGLLSGKHRFVDRQNNKIAKNSRFDHDQEFTANAHRRWWTQSCFQAVDIVRQSLLSSASETGADTDTDTNTDTDNENGNGNGNDNNHDVMIKSSQPLLIQCMWDWLLYHSKLDIGEYGDGVLVGSSTLAQVQQNIACILNAKPIRNENVLRATDKAWSITRCHPLSYFYPFHPNDAPF